MSLSWIKINIHIDRNMKYNKKYNRWFSTDGNVYRYSKREDKLVLVKQSKSSTGYMKFGVNGKMFYVHRALYETFIGVIPNNKEIDHINRDKENNSLENLKLVSHTENLYNRKMYEMNDDFSRKYFEHYGYNSSTNRKQYNRERMNYIRHGKCSWE